MSLVFATMFFFLVFDVLILVDDVMAGPILGLKFLDPCLQYSHTFIYSIRCLLLPTFRSLAAIVSEKSTVFTFSYRKAYVAKFDLSVK